MRASKQKKMIDNLPKEGVTIIKLLPNQKFLNSPISRIRYMREGLQVPIILYYSYYKKEDGTIGIIQLPEIIFKICQFSFNSRLNVRKDNILYTNGKERFNNRDGKNLTNLYFFDLNHNTALKITTSEDQGYMKIGDVSLAESESIYNGINQEEVLELYNNAPDMMEELKLKVKELEKNGAKVEIL